MIIHFTSEVTPYYKRGGLGDVTGVLPIYLSGDQPNVVISFFYEDRMQQSGKLTKKGSFYICLQGISYEFIYYHHRKDHVDFYFLNMSDVHLFSELESGQGDKTEDGDKPYKPDANICIYLYFAKAALQLIKELAIFPDFMIFHDWQVCGCFAFPHLLKDKTWACHTILLIHNYEYQGDILPDILPMLDEEIRNELEPIFSKYGHATLLSLGLKNADCVATVSHSYAIELKKGIPPHPGLKFLANMEKKICSLPNGIDDSIWSPDRSIFIPYSYDRFSAGPMKRKAKEDIAGMLGFPADDAPLVVMICRLTEQKGISLLMDFWNNEEIAVHHLGKLLDLGIRLIVCGRPAGGLDNVIDQRFSLAAKRFAGRFFYLPHYTEKWAHMLLAASDMILCPSLFEPCGLIHLYGMRFGSVPLVRPVGGLKDTVTDYDGHPALATGFYIHEFNRKSLWKTMRLAVKIYRDRPAEWSRLIRRCMEKDFSWTAQRSHYLDLFDKMKKEMSFKAATPESRN